MPRFPGQSAFATEIRHQWQIAWPLLIAQTAMMGTGVVDTIMAGRYSAQDLAAIAVGYNVWLPLYLLVLGILFATSTIVAQDFGAGRVEKIRRQLPQALWVALILGAVIAPLCFFSEPVIRKIGLSAATSDKTVDYVRMVAFGLPAVGVFQALRYHTQGIGLTRPFATASMVGFLLNIPLNWAFIYGNAGLPELGAAGCGVATAISMWISLGMMVFYIARSNTVADFLPRRWRVPPHGATIREILVLGLPIGLTFFFEVGVFAAIALLVATLGDAAIAAHQIAFNIWDIFYIPMLAVCTAMSTRIGHAIGAGERSGVRRALLVGVGISAAIALGTTLVLLTAPEAIIALYTDDASIRQLAVRLIGLAAFFIVVDAVQIVGSFTLRAYKETRFPFLVMVVSYWLVALPLGYWLGAVRATSAGDGAAGFWLGTIAGISVCALLILLRVRTLLRRPLPVQRRCDVANPSGLPEQIIA